MGLTAFLFFSSDPSDQTLHRRITPTEEQSTNQQERWNALAEYLRSDLKGRTGYPIRTWLQGSYKFGTQIRPSHKYDEFDIDLGVYFEWEGLCTDGVYRSDEIKNIVQTSLSVYSGDGVKQLVSPPKERCSRISFNGNFHIDVPSYHLDVSGDSRSLATQTRGWESSDPKALYLWFREQFEEADRTRVRRLIRYTKCWAALKFPEVAKRPSSTLLTVLVAEAFRNIAGENRDSDDQALTAVLGTMFERIQTHPKVLNPLDSGECLSDRLEIGDYNAFVERLNEFRGIAITASAENNVGAAAAMWGSAFEQFFPIPQQEQLAKALIEGSVGKSIAYNSSLPAVVQPDVHVRATSKINSRFQYSGMNKIGPIPKECDIFFDLVNRNELPGDAEVEWMVRNEGDEAETVNDLGHRAGHGLTAKESSAYVGTHYMDCSIKRGQRILGMKRIPVVIDNRRTPRPGR
jgi:hypothetical protein